MDDVRWTNVTSARAAYRRHRTTVDALPQELYLEVASRCNLRCEMCAISYDPRHQPGSGHPALFPPELFARLRPLFPTLLRAHLYGLGEPTLNKHLPAYLEELAGHGVETWFTTNATLIDDERAETYAKAGASRVSVSVDGATAGTYERIRRGARWSDLLRGLHALGAARRRHGNPRLTVNFVAMRSNVHELPALVDMCAEVGADEIGVEPLFDWGGSSPELGEHYRGEALSGATETEARELLREARRRARAAGIWFSSRQLADEGALDYPQRVAAGRDRGGLVQIGDGGGSGKRSSTAPWVCSEPWATAFVTTAGEVRTCCMNDTAFGNLYEQPFAEVWNGDRYGAFRGQHLRSVEEPLTPDGCGNCLKNGRARLSPFVATVEPVTWSSFEDTLAPPPEPVPGYRLLTPNDGATVADPLVVTGSLPPRGLLPFRHKRRHSPLRLLIDRTPVYPLEAARIDGRRFTMRVPVPFLTEGGHLLSLRGDDGVEPGYDRRTVFFRG